MRAVFYIDWQQSGGGLDSWQELGIRNYSGEVLK